MIIRLPQCFCLIVKNTDNFLFSGAATSVLELVVATIAMTGAVIVALPHRPPGIVLLIDAARICLNFPWPVHSRSQERCNRARSVLTK